MNSETCVAKGRLNIIVGTRSVLHLIAKVWQNIKKNRIAEKIEQEIDMERQTAVDHSFLSVLGKKLPAGASLNPKVEESLQKIVSLFTLFAWQTEHQRNNGPKILAINSLCY
jgi:hypothetical protein